MKKTVILFALIIGLVSTASGLSFRRVFEFPDAVFLQAFGFDSDQDGRQNLILSAYPGLIEFWEHIGFDKYVLEDSALPWSVIYDVGFLDADSLVDMVGSLCGGRCPLYVYESPSPDSHPATVVWQDSLFYNINGGYITDLDQDGIREVLFSYGYLDQPPWYHTCVYENAGDNQYTLVWEDTIRESSFFVHGDFDQDGQIEFVSGNAYGHVHIWECIGNDNYQYVFCDTLPRAGNYDVFCAHDMDGNGKHEFLFTATYPFFGRVYLYCYEATGDNYYDHFLIDSIIDLPLQAEYQGSSVCGDVDADGIEEIIWSGENQWHIYKAFGVQNYQRIYSSVWSVIREITRMNCYDLNENGYPEVIEAWIDDGYVPPHGVTIWEIEGVRLHQPNGGEVLNPDQQYLITWEKFDPPGADSFALFYSIDNGFNYDTIVMGLGSNDTSYLWTIPNTLSDSCKVMIWAYGPPRSGGQEPRGTAWDFSDNVFAIRETGIKTGNREQAAGNSLKILQNPTRSSNVQIQYSLSRSSYVSLKLYNSLGQLVSILYDGYHDAGTHHAGLALSISEGVYLLHYKSDGQFLNEKVVIFR